MQGRSCADAVGHFVHRWNKSVNDKFSIIYIWCDITKAFNSLLDFELFNDLVDTDLDDKFLYAMINLQCNNTYVIKIGKKDICLHLLN
jgi:hypothetical protein